MASAEYEAKRNSKTTVAVWTVKMSFPAFDDLPAKSFLWSTSSIEVDGEVFTRKLTAIPSGRHTRDRGNDYASFNAANGNNALYDEFYPYENLMERAEVVIKECYEIEPGFFESETRFFGYGKDFNLDESDKSLKFTAISDLSRTGFLVGGRILTRERCGTYFNVNGLESPLVSPCGWQTIQGGNPVFCSKYLKGVDGCASHNNTHRFYAVTGLANAVIEYVQGNGNGNGGFDYTTGSSCFVKGTLVLMANWTLKPIEQINAGDTVLAFNVFTDHLQEAKVLYPLRHIADGYELAEFQREEFSHIFGVTAEHLFYKGSSIFKPYGSLERAEAVQGILRDGKRAQTASVGSETVSGKVEVYNFHTDCGTYIVASEDMEIMLKVHNIKQVANLV